MYELWCYRLPNRDMSTKEFLCRSETRRTDSEAYAVTPVSAEGTLAARAETSIEEAIGTIAAGLLRISGIGAPGRK